MVDDNPARVVDHSPARAVERDLFGFLSRHSTLTLAYYDADGPQACAVFYALRPELAPRPLRLLFVTARSTRHGESLAVHGRVAFTVQRDGGDWTELSGVQGRGTVRHLDGAERTAGFAEYLNAYPAVAGETRLRGALERTGIWELTPAWLRLIDNARGFGFKQEWTRPN